MYVSYMLNSTLSKYPLGLCGTLSQLKSVEDLGFDYLEPAVMELLKPFEDDQVFHDSLKEIHSFSTPFKACNCFIPGNMKLCGAIDTLQQRKYVETALRRAESLGIKTIVFGLGKARNVPEGLDRSIAREQIIEFAAIAAEVAAQHGVTIVVEPLNHRECNILNTLSESAEVVESVNHPNLRLLIDTFHLFVDDDSVEDIIRYGSLIHHVHVATGDNRLPPNAEPCNFDPVLEALEKIEYAGSVSIEARWNPEHLPQALDFMRGMIK